KWPRAVPPTWPQSLRSFNHSCSRFRQGSARLGSSVASKVVPSARLQKHAPARSPPPNGVSPRWTSTFLVTSPERRSWDHEVHVTDLAGGFCRSRGVPLGTLGEHFAE